MGILAISTASVLVRLSSAPPLLVASYRVLLAALLLTPWALPYARREWPQLSRRDTILLVLAGVALAAHFATWFTSLALTSVASSVILVTTNPLFVGLASHFLFHERLRPGQVIAMVVAFAGSVVISYGDLRLSGTALLGDALALIGAMCASAYFILGKLVRRKLSTMAYVWPCYGIAGVLLLVCCVAMGYPLFAYSGTDWLIFVALAVGPQILGHSVFNWALAHFSALFVTLAILGEPIGATLLALLILREAPPPAALWGGLLIIAGIALASVQEQAPAPDPSPSST